MVTGLLEIARKWDIEIPCYGHAGDGNLHATPVLNPAWTEAEWHDRPPPMLEEIFTLTARPARLPHLVPTMYHQSAQPCSSRGVPTKFIRSAFRADFRQSAVVILSGEHGIGHKRLAWMPLFCSLAHLEMRQAIKLALDPHLIHNPGKIIRSITPARSSRRRRPDWPPWADDASMLVIQATDVVN